jgi:exopolysaccharide biosynthesis polyprenyl glycosylphosphotransferase
MASERGASTRREIADGSGADGSNRASGLRFPRSGAAAAPLIRPLAQVVPRGAADVDDGQLSRRALRRDTTYRRSLAVADMLAGAAALLVAIVLLGEDSLDPTILAVLPVLVIVAKAVGLYDRDQHLVRKTTLDEAPTVFQLSTLYALMTWLADDLVVEGHLGRHQVVGLWVLLFVLILLGRAAARRVAREFGRAERCLLVGDSSAAEWARRKLEMGQGVKATLVGCVPFGPRRRKDDPHSPDLDGLDSLIAQTVEDQRIDRVIIAPVASDSDEMLNMVRLVKGLGVQVSVLPRLFEVVGSSVEFDDVEGMMLLGVRRYGLTTSSRVLKRGMDVVGGVALLALLTPLLMVVAMAVKLTSPGPVLFRQRRMGRNDGEFEMLKFRTMVDGADSQKDELHEQNEAGEGLFKIADDPRITSVGKYLRRTSLDELPQLFNVLRGEMSLVGPRPLVIDEDRQVEGWQRGRLRLSPGMTGPWQVFGSSRIPLHEMVKIDYLYGANWSLWSDVKILLRTLPYVLGRRGM